MTTLACPHCRVMAHFDETWGYTYHSPLRQQSVRVSIEICDACHLPVCSAYGEKSREQEYWPVSTARRSFADVPESIAAVAQEAHACVTVQAPRAAVAMARAAIEALARDMGIHEGSLYRKIEALQVAGHISTAMNEAAHEIRFAGNEAAHSDITHELINVADAQEVLALMDAILERVYQEPARVARVRERRRARTEGSEEAAD